jgi:hypothetical protein
MTPEAFIEASKALKLWHGIGRPRAHAYQINAAQFLRVGASTVRRWEDGEWMLKHGLHPEDITLSDPTFCSFEGNPTRWVPGEAWSFHAGAPECLSHTLRHCPARPPWTTPEPPPQPPWPPAHTC